MYTGGEDVVGIGGGPFSPFSTLFEMDESFAIARFLEGNKGLLNSRFYNFFICRSVVEMNSNFLPWSVYCS